MNAYSRTIARCHRFRVVERGRCCLAATQPTFVTNDGRDNGNPDTAIISPSSAEGRTFSIAGVTFWAVTSKIPKLRRMEMISLTEAAEMMGVSLRTVQNLVKAKRLVPRKIGRRTLLLLRDLHTFLDSSTDSTNIPSLQDKPKPQRRERVL